MVGIALSVWLLIDIALRFMLVYICNTMNKSILIASGKEISSRIRLINLRFLRGLQIAGLISTIGLCVFAVIMSNGTPGLAIFMIFLCLVDPSKSRVIVRSYRLSKEYKRVHGKIAEYLKRGANVTDSSSPPTEPKHDSHK